MSGVGGGGGWRDQLLLSPRRGPCIGHGNSRGPSVTPPHRLFAARPLGYPLGAFWNKPDMVFGGRTGSVDKRPAGQSASGRRDGRMSGRTVGQPAGWPLIRMDSQFVPATRKMCTSNSNPTPKPNSNLTATVTLIKTEYWDQAGGGGNISYEW